MQKFKLLLLMMVCILSSLSYAQKNKLNSKNTFFYMEVNGKNIDKKINWDKINPYLDKLNKNNNKKSNWNDYHQTGIAYTSKQIHYAQKNDSVLQYTMLFGIDNAQKFNEFIATTKKEGQEITQKNNYSYIDLDNETLVAYNDKKAVLKFIKYNKPSKALEEEAMAEDSDAPVVDSTDAVMDNTAVIQDDEWQNEEDEEIDEVKEVKPFNYKNEIKYLKERIKNIQDLIQYHKDEIKSFEKEIADIRKTIAHLEKYKKYPADKDPYKPNEEAEEQEEAAKAEDEDNDREAEFQNEMEAERIEKFKVIKNIAEADFNSIFSSAFSLDVDKEVVKNKDEKADIFVFSNLDSFLGKERKFLINNPLNIFTEIYGGIFNVNSSYNLYFDEKQVKLVNLNEYQNLNFQKSISKAYRVKKNKQLSNLISDKTIGSFAINVSSEKTMNMLYEYMKVLGGEKWQTYFETISETMKIFLDEKAIAKVFPGNSIFILNDLKSKKVDYTSYEFDENYESIEVTKSKNIAVPDFTIAIATKNEAFWYKILDALLLTKTPFYSNAQKIGNVYYIKNKSNDPVENLFISVKDGLVLFTSSMENLDFKKNNNSNKNWNEQSSKNSYYGRLNLRKIIQGLDREIESPKDRKIFQYLKKNVGDIIYTTNAKENGLETEIIYEILQNKSENSLMYFFDMFDFLEKNATKTVVDNEN